VSMRTNALDLKTLVEIKPCGLNVTDGAKGTNESSNVAAYKRMEKLCIRQRRKQHPANAAVQAKPLVQISPRTSYGFVSSPNQDTDSDSQPPSTSQYQADFSAQGTANRNKWEMGGGVIGATNLSPTTGSNATQVTSTKHHQQGSTQSAPSYLRGSDCGNDCDLPTSFRGTRSASSYLQDRDSGSDRAFPRGFKSSSMRDHEASEGPESSPFDLHGRDVPGITESSSSYPSFKPPHGSHASVEQLRHWQPDPRKSGRYPHPEKSQSKMPSSSKTLLRSGKAGDKRRASEDIPKSSEDVLLTADVDQVNFVDPLGPNKGYADWEHRSVYTMVCS
jgi:hypothetical protein